MDWDIFDNVALWMVNICWKYHVSNFNEGKRIYKILYVFPFSKSQKAHAENISCNSFSVRLLFDCVSSFSARCKVRGWFLLMFFSSKNLFLPVLFFFYINVQKHQNITAFFSFSSDHPFKTGLNTNTFKL